MFLEREEPNHFGAGPSQLPISVLQQSALDLINFNNIGLGIGEISHRSEDATKVIADAKNHLKQLMNIPDTHEVFFMQGGGTAGFSSIASNLAAAHLAKTGKVGTAGYLVTGSWSQKAFEEAKRLRIPSEVIFNSKDFNDGKFGSIPLESEWSAKLEGKNLAYVYLCENETVNGVEWPKMPECITSSPNIELVADLSSDILSREIPVSEYGLILAVGQKNIALAGLTVYIIKKSILEDISNAAEDRLHEVGLPITPIAFDFPTVVKNDSAYNTVPIFNLHVMDLSFQNLLKKGGVAAQQSENEQKASLLYQALDQFPDFYDLRVEEPFRSKMNVVFSLKDEGLDEEFLTESSNKKLTGLKGHRSVGGFRASIYNALSVHSVLKLANFLRDFAEQNS